ncbi:MAG: sigma-70 family RNA polymerase sigma factor [Anaerolineaceae bacterium]|nr:sigma-70 family RNA polymerase sigma factor [Anaerolineaceae bacterium]
MLELTINEMTLSQYDDLALIKRIARHEEEALNILFARHGDKLYGYAVRILENPALAEDSLQESLLAIWQGAKRFRGEGSVLAWMFGIVHHKAMRVFRRKPTLELDEEMMDPVRFEAQVDERLSSIELKRQLREGIKTLSMEHRTVLELVFYQGMSLREVAKICDIPEGTVKSRLKYAKDKLRGVISRQRKASAVNK